MPEAEPVASPSARPGLFRRRNFAIYWAGGLASNIGTWLQNVTASIVILALTHSPLLVGVLNFATFAPIFLLSMVGGMISDRFDRRLVVIVAQSFSLVVALVMTVLSANGKLTGASLIGLSFLIGSAYAIAKPAMSAIIPSLVERDEIAHATAVNTLQFNMGQLGGSAMATAVLAFSSPTWAFGLNAVSFLGPIGAMLVLRRTLNIAPTRRRQMRGTGKEGIRFALRTKAVVAILIAVALSNASVEVLRALAPSLVSRDLHLGGDRAGLLITAYSIGGTVGLLTFRRVSQWLSSGRLLAVAFGLQVIGVAGIAASPVFALSAVFAVPIGLGFSLNIPTLVAALQQSTPDEFLGRVMSMFSMSMLGLRPVFSVTAGALASIVDTRVAFAICVAFPVVALRFVANAGSAVSDARAGVRPRTPTVEAPVAQTQT
ncbi:MAG: MFS transporter [Acidothermaceae bacterium]